MGDPFGAIGFNIYDEESFQKLAEQAHHLGTPSAILRHNVLLQGYCWQLGEGLEVWTMLHESKAGTYYADCRPAFRNKRSYQLSNWEIIEFIEDGEALVSGQSLKSNILFELQNFSEVTDNLFQQPVLSASIAGLCYQANFLTNTANPQITALSPPRPIQSSSKFAENDFLVVGQLSNWREISNPITQAKLLVLEVEVRGSVWELIVNQSQCQGELRSGTWLSAETWMQGYLLSSQAQHLKYEGLDYSTPTSQFWSKLRRDN